MNNSKYYIHHSSNTIPDDIGFQYYKHTPIALSSLCLELSTEFAGVATWEENPGAPSQMDQWLHSDTVTEKPAKQPDLSSEEASKGFRSKASPGRGRSLSDAPVTYGSAIDSVKAEHLASQAMFREAERWDYTPGCRELQPVVPASSSGREPPKEANQRIESDTMPQMAKKASFRQMMESSPKLAYHDFPDYDVDPWDDTGNSQKPFQNHPNPSLTKQYISCSIIALHLRFACNTWF